MTFSYTRYLAAKKTVDDRALNRGVLQHLSSLQTTPLRVLEIGAGLGTMIARLIEWGLLRQAHYCLLDVDAQLLADSRQWLRNWASAAGYKAELEDNVLLLTDGHELEVRVECHQAELGDYLQNPHHPCDLLIANAFLDLVEVPVMLPRLFRLLVPGGLYWFSINFDGHTIFEPEHPHDEAFMAVYNRSMDERIRYGRPAGESKTGRHLFRHLKEAGASLLAAGSSDWVVYAQEGRYPADEAFFLHCILDTIEVALRADPQLQEVDPWMSLRRAQVDSGELLYLAHQLDFLGKAPNGWG